MSNTDRINPCKYTKQLAKKPLSKLILFDNNPLITQKRGVSYSVKSDLQEVVLNICENYVCEKDVHQAAYELNPEYKKFWDNVPQEQKKTILKAQKMVSIGEGGWKAKEYLFHAGTMGISYGLKKLFQMGKPTREERIKRAVTDAEFTTLLTSVNESLVWEEE